MFRKILMVIFFLLCVSPCFGASYYIDPDNGNDSWDGTRGAYQSGTTGPWASWTAAYNAGLSSGDDVYQICGSTVTVSSNTTIARVNWAGVDATNYAVIGAYYMDGGSEVVGVSGSRPIITGSWTYPTLDYYGLVDVGNNLQFVKVQDLDITSSYKRGINFRSGALNGIVTRCFITGAYDEAIIGRTSIAVTYNKISETGKSRVIDYLGATSGWPVGGIQCSGTSSAVITNNWIYNIYSEAIVGGYYATVTDNVVGDSMSVGIYDQSQHSQEIARNLIYGTDSTDFNNIPSGATYAGQTDWKGPGIAIALEVGAGYGNIYNTHAHHNIVINRNAGLRVYDGNATYSIQSFDFNNNYLIDNEYNFRISDSGGNLNGTVSVINNISYPYHADSVHVNSTPSTLTNWTVGPNQWAIDAGPSGMWSDVGDSTADPAPIQAAWKGAINSLSDITIANLVTTAAATGATLSATFDDLIYVDGVTDYTTTDPSADPIVVNTYDADDLAAWPMGALTGGTFVYDVSPSDGETGVSVTKVATWDYAASVDDVDLWLDSGACAAVTDCDGSPDSDDDADKAYDMSTLTVSTTYCLGIKANSGASQGECQEFDFTTAAGPPVDQATFGSIVHSSAAGDIVHSSTAGDIMGN